MTDGFNRRGPYTGESSLSRSRWLLRGYVGVRAVTCVAFTLIQARRATCQPSLS